MTLQEAPKKKAAMTRPARIVLRYAVRIAISAGLLAALLSTTNVRQMAATIMQASIPLVLVAVFITLAHRVFSAVRWFILIRCHDNQVDFSTVLRVTFVSGFVGLFFPGIVGIELIKIAGLTKSTRDLTLSASSVLMDRILGLAAIALLAIVGWFAMPVDLPPSIAITATIFLVALAIAAAVMSHPSLPQVAARVPFMRAGIAIKTLNKVRGCIEVYRGKPGTMLLSSLLAIGFQLSRVLQAYVVILSLGIKVPFSYVMFITPIMFFVELLPLSVSGLGVRDVGYVYFLSLINIPREQAFSVSVMLFIMVIVSALPGVVVVLLGSSRAAKDGRVHHAAVVGTALSKKPAIESGALIGKSE